MVAITVTDLFRFPVKSLGGHGLDAASIGARGIDGDRRWMIVDENDRFVTRREMPELALFTVCAEDDGLLIDHPRLGAHRVATPARDAATIAARVWGDTVWVRPSDTTANAYLTRGLGRPVRLVHQGDDAIRPIDPAFAKPGDHVSLSDGYPVLIVAQASLAALNADLAVPVPITRFRPNIVLSGADPWAEDHWRRIRIGHVTFRIAKPCSRCVITTQQPDTGARLEGNEPLHTLRRIGRMGRGGVMFGQNAIAETFGGIATGDAVEVLETGESNLR